MKPPAASPTAAAVTRRAQADGATLSEAVCSPCDTWRYSLTRRWGDGAPLLFVMLNPSTATELRNDPTVARCESRARAMGFPAFTVTNLFALRATDPRALRNAPDPIGPANDAILRKTAAGAAMILCAWGNHGTLLNRAATVTTLLRKAGQPLHHLGLTRSGQPRHPLYIAKARSPEPWT